MDTRTAEERYQDLKLYGSCPACRQPLMVREIDGVLTLMCPGGCSDGDQFCAELSELSQ